MVRKSILESYLDAPVTRLDLGDCVRGLINKILTFF